MSERKAVFHPQFGYSMCYPVSTSPASAGLTHPEHGTRVVCGVCGRLGVIPDGGHELEFLPPGTERTVNGGFILKFG
jgi:hypothetical protein